MRYLGTRPMPMPQRMRRQMGDLQTDITAGSNILSQLNSLITGAPTSTVYTPTTVPLSAGASTSSFVMPLLIVAGAYFLLRKKS